MSRERCRNVEKLTIYSNRYHTWDMYGNVGKSTQMNSELNCLLDSPLAAFRSKMPCPVVVAPNLANRPNLP
jgi:hypothetical protein